MRTSLGWLDREFMVTPCPGPDRIHNEMFQLLTPEQQKMATVLVTPPRNSQINTGPFNAYARSPGLGILLLQVSDFVRFNSALPPRLRKGLLMLRERRATNSQSAT